MDGICMYNCPTFFLFWKCLDDMSYWTNLYRTVADNELHFFTISNLNYTVFVSLAHILVCVLLYRRLLYVFYYVRYRWKSFWAHVSCCNAIPMKIKIIYLSITLSPPRQLLHACSSYHSATDFSNYQEVATFCWDTHYTRQWSTRWKTESVFFFRGLLLVSYDLQLSHFVG